MGVKLVSSGGGSVEINPPSTASNFTATMPAGTGNVVVNGVNGTLVSATAVTASGTAVDFTGIPSWVKRITVMFSGVSGNGTSQFQIQLGDAGGIETTGYSGGTTSTTAGVTYSAGFQIIAATNAAANVWQSIITLVKIDGNTWCSISQACVSSSVATGSTQWGTGSKTLSDTLTQVRITTVNGTDTFDAGTINIMYE